MWRACTLLFILFFNFFFFTFYFFFNDLRESKREALERREFRKVIKRPSEGLEAPDPIFFPCNLNFLHQFAKRGNFTLGFDNSQTEDLGMRRGILRKGRPAGKSGWKFMRKHNIQPKFYNSTILPHPSLHPHGKGRGGNDITSSQLSIKTR